MSIVTIGYKAILPVMGAVFNSRAMAAVFSNRLEPAVEADQDALAQAARGESELDMHRPAPVAREGRTTRLLHSIVSASQRSRRGLGGPRRSVDRAFQEYTPNGFDW
jgi:hypothetical protein